VAPFPAFQQLYQNPVLRKCIHDPYEDCIEAGKISWDNCNASTFLHIRFDGCVCKSSAVKKCDCIIFRFGFGRSTMFAVETKEENPDLPEARAQLQTCIDVMVPLLPNPKSQFEIIPVLCAKSFAGLRKRSFWHYRVRVFGKEILIKKRHYGQDINTL
jgi:hypothetical protein